MKKLLLATGLLAGVIAVLPSSASAVPGYYCEASVIRSTVTGEPLVANRPPVRPCEDDVESLAALVIPPTPPTLGGLTLLEAYTNDFPRRPTVTSATEDPIDPTDPKTNGSVARAKVATLSAGPISFLAGLAVTATGISAQVDTTCAGPPPIRPVNSSSGGLATLTINGVPQMVGSGFQDIPLPLIGSLKLNVVSETGTGLTFLDPKIMTRRAIQIDIDPTAPLGMVLAPLVGTQVVIAEAKSGFEGVASPCGIPIPGGA